MEQASDTALHQAADDTVYAGFWPRLAALLLDFLILSPLATFLTWASGHVYRFEAWAFLPWAMFALFYSVYLVRRYGGTPGKRLMKLRIVKVDGQPVSYREALLRYLPQWLAGLGLSIASVMAVLSLSEAEYFAPTTYMERAQLLATVMPSWHNELSIALNIWIFSEFVVMLTNRKRRAIHDFIAGTVVIKDPRREETVEPVVAAEAV